MRGGKAKKLRKLVYGIGSDAQAKKHETRYEIINAARGVRLLSGEVIYPDGTRRGVGLRAVYKALKRGC